MIFKVNILSSSGITRGGATDRQTDRQTDRLTDRQTDIIVYRDSGKSKNWRPISLLNLDTKLLTKVLASKLKPILPSIIKSDQNVYVAGGFIGESASLISDIIETAKNLDIEGYILTIDIEKAFSLLTIVSYCGYGKL